MLRSSRPASQRPARRRERRGRPQMRLPCALPQHKRTCARGARPGVPLPVWRGGRGGAGAAGAGVRHRNHRRPRPQVSASVGHSGGQERRRVGAGAGHCFNPARLRAHAPGRTCSAHVGDPRTCTLTGHPRPPNPPNPTATAPSHGTSHPPPSRTRATLFQRGSTDLFRFDGPDVGRLRCATIRTVERGLLGTAWWVHTALGSTMC